MDDPYKGSIFEKGNHALTLPRKHIPSCPLLPCLQRAPS